MIKSIFIYIFSISFLFFFGLKTHTYFIEKQNIELSFSLQNIYIFYAVFTLIVLIKFKIISNIEKVFEQLGYIYLGVLLLKIVFFCIVFYSPVLTSEDLSKPERISLLIPMAIFLIAEVYFVSKLIQQK